MGSKGKAPARARGFRGGYRRGKRGIASPFSPSLKNKLTLKNILKRKKSYNSFKRSLIQYNSTIIKLAKAPTSVIIKARNK